MLILVAVLTLSFIAGSFGLILGYAAIRFRVEGNPIVEQIDAILPQTQCGQCGFAGCRPYAEALARGEAPINACPPGGESTMIALADLLGVTRQTAVLAYQMGDGFTNLIVPTNPVLMGALSLAGVPWAKWARWILLLQVVFFAFGLLALAVAVQIQFSV